MEKINTSNFISADLSYMRIFKIVILAIPVLIYIYYIAQYFWTLPAPSDPLQYVGPSIWEITDEYFPWIDRVMVAIGIDLFSFLFSQPYAGMIYIAVVNCLIIILGMFWLYKKGGFMASLFSGILFISSYFLLGYSTYIYADQTLTLFSLLAFVLFFYEGEGKFFKPMILTGIFVALAVFSKIIGLVLLLFFVMFLIRRKDYRKLLKLSVGLGIGIMLVFICTYLLFGFDSIENLISGIKYNFESNTTFRTFRTDVSLSYFKVIAREYYLPVFLSLMIFIGAYKKFYTRNLYLVGFLFLFCMSFLVSFTMHVRAVANYIYPAFVFCVLAMSLYLGELFNDRKRALFGVNKFSFRGKKELFYALICLLLVFWGIKIGIDNYPFFANIGSEHSPFLLRIAYPVIPFLIIGTMIFIEYSKSRTAIFLFMIFIAFWCSAFNGAFAYKKAYADRERASFYYEAAPILNEVPAKTFSIYVKEWNENNNVERIKWVYSFFFNEKYSNSSQAETEEEIRNNVSFIKEEKEIPNAKGNQILTDSPEDIYRYFPYAQEIKRVLWEEKELTILEISRNTIPEKYNYESNLSD